MMIKHKARKRFGQNFLQDPSMIHRIIFAIYPKSKDYMVEIGPGLGALTAELVDQVEQLTVIELDRNLIPKLEFLFKDISHLKIVQADALRFDFGSLLAHKPNTKKIRVVGNLPYNISTQLVFHLLQFSDIIQDMHFMFQKEVANRLSAQVGTKNYGRLSVMAQYFCDIETLFDVPPTAFKPQPKVNSAIVRLVPHKQIPFPTDNFPLFEKIVKTAFMQRRKTLKNALKNMEEFPEDWAEQCGIDSNRRPEQITLEEYVRLAELWG